MNLSLSAEPWDVADCRGMLAAKGVPIILLCKGRREVLSVRKLMNTIATRTEGQEIAEL